MQLKMLDGRPRKADTPQRQPEEHISHSMNEKMHEPHKSKDTPLW